MGSRWDKGAQEVKLHAYSFNPTGRLCVSLKVEFSRGLCVSVLPNFRDGHEWFSNHMKRLSFSGFGSRFPFMIGTRK